MSVAPGRDGEVDGRVVVVGAGHAAAQLCASLRQEGWEGEVVLVGDEPSLPYERPPLSKGHLAGTTERDELLLRTPAFYDKAGVTHRQGRVTAIDRDERTVALADGEALAYDHLVLCTGARARPLPVDGADLEGVHLLRDLADVEGIRADLTDAAHAVVVGAGYVGLEVAASLRSLAVDVTVLEAQDRALQRVTAPPVSAFYERVHREAGVEIRLGVGVTSFVGDERVRGVRLADGGTIAADVVVVGIGAVPRVELARDAGLPVEDGIVVDDHGRTADERVYAAGDCCNYPDARYGRRLRLESVPSAVEQAKSVAAAICGKERPIAALPWFWSDQYDHKLQIAGISTGHDQIVLRGDPDGDDGFACFYLAAGRLAAADCIDQPTAFVFAKRAIGQDLSPDPAALADVDVPLASLL